MKDIAIACISLFIFNSVDAQYVHKIKADSVFITNDSCNAELIIENATRDTLGFLFNKGNGRTEFRKILKKINDSIYIIGGDTLSLARYLSGPAGGSGAIQYNHNGRFGGNAGKLFWDTLNNRMHIGGSNPESILTITKDSLGSDIISETDGITLVNNTPATISQSQRSPAIRFVAQGWKTGSPAASQQIEIRNYLMAENSPLSPMYKFIWEERRNNGTRYPVMILGEHGLNVMSSGSGAGGIALNLSAPIANTISGGNGLHFRTHSLTDTVAFSFQTPMGFNQTSGATKFFRLVNGGSGFVPSSGSSNYSMLSLEPRIDQTGTANGISRAIHIIPNLISAADFRAIEVDTGKSYFRSIHLTGPGDKLNIATGSNASIGTATIVSGSVTVSTSAVTSNSVIVLSYNTPSGTTGQLSAPAGSIVAGTSFTINSTSGSDNSTVNYWIIN